MFSSTLRPHAVVATLLAIGTIGAFTPILAQGIIDLDTTRDYVVVMHNGRGAPASAALLAARHGVVCKYSADP